MKVITDQQLRELGIALSTQVEAAADAWRIAVKCVPLSSRQYKYVCQSGRKAVDAYNTFRNIADDRWTFEEVSKYFTVTTGYAFN